MNPINTTAPVKAVATLTDNGTPITPDAVAWESIFPSIATIDPVTGVVTPVSPGSTTIRATLTGTITSGTVSEPYSVQAIGTVNVTELGDNLVATVDFQPIA